MKRARPQDGFGRGTNAGRPVARLEEIAVEVGYPLFTFSRQFEVNEGILDPYRSDFLRAKL
jgi:hypothetical protein